MRYGGDRRYGWREYLAGNGTLKTVLEGRMLGKQGRGRKRIGFLDKLKGSRPYSELKKAELGRKGMLPDCTLSTPW